MRHSRRIRDERGRSAPSANERLKQRWRSCLNWSLAAAALLHLAAFAAWPAREVLNPTPSMRLGAAQLVPLASLRAPRETPVAALPTREETERPPEVVPDDLEVEIGALFEAIELPPPSLADPDPPTMATALRTAMIVERASAGPVGPAVPGPSFTWPELRNPRAVIGFLRSGYNPLALSRAPERFVSVRISLDAAGAVEWCEVERSSGHPVVDELAVAVIQKIARFSPGSRRGAPVPVVVVLSIPFEQPW